MTGDPLDRIEAARGRIVQALNLRPLVPPNADDETLNVVNEAWFSLSGLVEIARAARVFLEEHQRQKAAVLGEFDLLVYDEMETRLREALARLDGGTE